MSRDKEVSNGVFHRSMNQPWPESKAALTRVLRAKESIDNKGKKNAPDPKSRAEYEAAVLAYDSPVSNT